MCESINNPPDRVVETPAGKVYIEGPVKSTDIGQLAMEEDLKNFRPPEKQKKALMQIADSRDGILYIIRHENTIAGYVSFHEPDPYARWSRHPRIMELGAIEISSKWRKYKLAKKLLKVAFENPVMEDYIVLTIEFSWHWDLENTGLDLWNYQRMLTSVFGSVGLVKMPTNDPDILEHPANVLMVRIGKNVSEEDVREFDELRFIDEGIFSKN
ncbi:acetyltransferase AcuA [Desulfocucumis palustris]|uniref:Acetyltransferase AcuA n=1 Tax=Desulfocucumis palustris TaxID=1898651 RepID=A0A2L2XFT4_9FIRM|nr:GNAT family N-acetyltransferase [Desulfocucumis palustris]GBF34992.1 acetyltransferase AcuA [Desulfocucumis palustris]